MFRGVLDARARSIPDEIVLAAAHQLAARAEDVGLTTTHLLPTMEEASVFPHVAAAVAVKAVEGSRHRSPALTRGPSSWSRPEPAWPARRSSRGCSRRADSSPRCRTNAPNRRGNHDAGEIEPEPDDPDLDLRTGDGEGRPALVPLLVRLKRLNEEFDPLLKVRGDVEARAEEVLKRDLDNPNAVLLAAEGVGAERDKIVGVVRALIGSARSTRRNGRGHHRHLHAPDYRRKGAGEFSCARSRRA